MQIRQQLIPAPTKRNSGIKNLGIKFIVAHDTGNINSTAQQNVTYYINSANEIEASAHIFVDDKDAIECVDQSNKAWHVIYGATKDNEMYGDDANDIALGVELCYFEDKERSIKAYKNYVQVIADLCKKYNLDTSKVVGHCTLDPQRKTDPINAFSRIGVTWVSFINDLNNLLKPQVKVPTREEAISEIKRLSQYL